MTNESTSGWETRLDETMRLIRERVAAILQVMDRHEAQLRDTLEIIRRMEARFENRNSAE